MGYLLLFLGVSVTTGMAAALLFLGGDVPALVLGWAAAIGLCGILLAVFGWRWVADPPRRASGRAQSQFGCAVSPVELADRVRRWLETRDPDSDGVLVNQARPNTVDEQGFQISARIRNVNGRLIIFPIRCSGRFVPGMGGGTTVELDLRPTWFYWGFVCAGLPAVLILFWIAGKRHYTQTWVGDVFTLLFGFLLWVGFLHLNLNTNRSILRSRLHALLNPAMAAEAGKVPGPDRPSEI